METRSKGSPALPKLSAEIWKEEDEIQETAEERAPICSLARDFNFKREPEEENEYVPCTKGAHYVWVKCSQPKNGTFVLSNPDQYLSMNARCQFEGFIPIAFLAALASDSVNWEKIARFVTTNSFNLLLNWSLTHSPPAALGKPWIRMRRSSIKMAKIWTASVTSRCKPPRLNRSNKPPPPPPPPKGCRVSSSKTGGLAG